MLVTLHGDAKEVQYHLEGHYILQPNPVNKKPWWFKKGDHAIWASPSGLWTIGQKKNLGSTTCFIHSKDVLEDPLQALTWKYTKDVWHESKDILVTKPGNL